MSCCARAGADAEAAPGLRSVTRKGNFAGIPVHAKVALRVNDSAAAAGAVARERFDNAERAGVGL